MISVAMYQPDIPQNVGAMMRLCACVGAPLHIIEPCGFPWDERKIRQSGLDYIDFLQYERHASWEKFTAAAPGRLILMTTKSAVPYFEFQFQISDILIAGRESAGVTDEIHEAVDARVTIPMREGPRSLNVVTAAAMILGEAKRQIAFLSS